ncbi:transposase, partial [Escherichia coli]|nr:transposase [Escherichia coli]
MTKTVSTSKKPRKQHSPEFRSEALKLAERIGVTAAASELSLYESQLYNWRTTYAGKRKSYNASRPTGGPESTGACRISSVTFAIKSKRSYSP